MPIGPQLPPSGSRRSTTPSDESDDDGGFGPALPPELAAKRAAQVGPQRPHDDDGDGPAVVGPQRPGPSVGPSGPPGPSVGPALPSGPSVGPSRPSSAGPARPNADESDSDDDFVGPKLSDATAGAGVAKSAAEEFREREARWARERAEGAAAGPKMPQRDEWMLAPPPGGGVLGGLADPLKRPTAFQKSAKPAVTADEQRGWTETPAQRAAREADERAGVKPPPATRASEDDKERKRRRDKEDAMRRQIEDHNKSSRGASLLDQHQAKKKRAAADGEEDDAPAIWDHDKMMGVTGRLLTDQERSNKIKEARQLNDRFGHGKGGAYM